MPTYGVQNAPDCPEAVIVFTCPVVRFLGVNVPIVTVVVVAGVPTMEKAKDPHSADSMTTGSFQGAHCPVMNTTDVFC
jgi:hypothetical protein